MLKADMQKYHERGSREALGSGIRSHSLFPTACRHRFRFRGSQNKGYLETTLPTSIWTLIVKVSIHICWKGLLSLVHKLIKITIVVFSSFFGSIKRKEAFHNGQQSWKTCGGRPQEKQRKYTPRDV